MLADNSRQAGEWIHEQGLRRWPTIVLELQFGLFGHRQRQTEGFDTLGCAIPGNPLKMRPWRSQTGGDSNKACRQPLALVTLVAFTLTVLRESYTHDRASWKGRCVDWSPNSMSNGMVGSFSVAGVRPMGGRSFNRNHYTLKQKYTKTPKLLTLNPKP